MYKNEYYVRIHNTILYLSAMSDGSLFELEIKNLNERIFSYPIFESISPKIMDQLESYLSEKLKLFDQDEVLDHVLTLISEKYRKTASCSVLETCAGDLLIHEKEQKFVDLLASKLSINLKTQKILWTLYTVDISLNH